MCLQHHILPPSPQRLLTQESQLPLTMTIMRLLSSKCELPCLNQAMLKLTSLHRRYKICKQQSNPASSVSVVVRTVMWHRLRPRLAALFSSTRDLLGGFSQSYATRRLTSALLHAWQMEM